MGDVSRLEAVRTDPVHIPYRPPTGWRPAGSRAAGRVALVERLVSARRHPVGRLIVGVTALLLAALGMIAAFYFLGGGDKESPFTKLGFETAKIAIQLVLAGVVGGVLVQEYNRGRARRAAANEFRKQVLRSLIAAYSDVKKVRRILRARSTRCHHRADRPIGLPGAAYDAQMTEINDAQIRLEVLARELKVFKDLFQDMSGLTRCIVGMEKYLKRVVSEYERSRKEPNGCACVPLDSLPQLQGLIGKGPFGAFRAGFADHFHAALSIIEQERIRVL
jgi:hypothetical protein